jgi:hypothetical protein
MHPVSCPPKFTFYDFCKTVNPWFEEWRNARPVEISKAHTFAKEILLRGAIIVGDLFKIIGGERRWIFEI